MLFPIKKRRHADARLRKETRYLNVRFYLLRVRFCELVEIEVEVTQLSAEGANL